MTRTLISIGLAAFLISAGTSAFAQEHEHRGGHICANPKLSDEDKAACTKAMQDAQSRDDREKVRATYQAKIKAAG